MEIYLDDHGELLPEQLELLNRVTLAVAKYCDCPGNSEVSISFINAEEIRVLNRDYRGKDTATDVLSFPINDELAMGSISLGDIVICMDVAREQAKEYGHSLNRELAFLLVHGLLHLFGYEHETSEDETEMKAAQNDILNTLRIGRE
ncbi:MAG: rRNA maturation RNase YbeY [Defluviitaleaceae bacterium]|nr:rRNA maturation RNase YbeY [Defluviitaleaceae bacterium]